jgi:small GTP-binding protein
LHNFLLVVYNQTDSIAILQVDKTVHWITTGRKFYMATLERKRTQAEEEHCRKLRNDILASIFRTVERPKTMNKTKGQLGLAVIKNLPAGISMVQGLMKAVNWKAAQREVLEGLNNTVVIVGQANAGKSTLFNKLKGQNLSPTSSQAGTTKTLVCTEFGPFTLVDTPGHLPDVMAAGISQASVIVFLIDATRGLQEEDRELYQIIRNVNKPTIIAVNKIDQLKEKGNGDHFATEVALALNTAGVIPISARTGENLAEELIPVIIDASPEAALAIGREIPAYRRAAAQRIIRNSTLVCLAAGLEPIPFVDIPILLAAQVRLVLNLAALYGEEMDSEDAMKHARALILTLASGAGMRYIAGQAAKFVPFGGDFVAGVIAGAATWSIGQVALEYYEDEKKLSPKRLQELYQSFYQRFRRENKPSELRQQVEQALTAETAEIEIVPTEISVVQNPERGN